MDISAVSNAYYNIWKLCLEGSMAYQGNVVKEDYIPASYLEQVAAHKQVLYRQFKGIEMTTEIVRAFQKVSVEMRCRFPYIKELNPTNLTVLRFVGAGVKERANWNNNVNNKINSYEVKKLFIETLNKEIRNVFQ